MRLIRPFFLLKLFYPEAIFRIKTTTKELILTFDDGPDPDSTPRILNILESHNVKAIFFCTGQLAERNPELISLIKSKGHIIGNHGYHHLDGWKTATRVYLRNFSISAAFTSKSLLRPPYGRIRQGQYRELLNKYRIVFWDLMPHDYDKQMSSEKVLKILKKKIRSGSVIVLHDKTSSSVLSFLPEFLKYAEIEGYMFTIGPFLT